MRSTDVLFAFLLAAISLDRPASAQRTLRVPAQYGTIQAAISAAAGSGDTILVAPGTYFGTIDLKGKTVWLRSSGGYAVTTLDGQAAGPVVSFAPNQLSNATVEGFTITNGVGQYGGGISILSGSPRIIGNRIIGNFANVGRGAGGGIYCATPRVAVIERNVIASNRSSWIGGGVAAIGGSIRMIDNGIENNRSGTGGGVSARGGYTVFRRNTVRNNTAGIGGGMSVSEGSCDISDNRFEGNTAGPAGGALHISDTFLPTFGIAVNRNLVTGNTASRGGGISVSSLAAKLGGNIIRSNMAYSDGGGVYGGIGSGSFLLRTNVIADNQADRGGGVFLWPNAGVVMTIASNTVANNSARLGGGLYAMVNRLATVPLVGNVIWGNTGTGGPAQIGWNGPQPTGVYNDVQGGWPGTGNVSLDPRFNDPGRGDYHLPVTSPCADIGPTGRPELASTDVDGAARQIGAGVDIGADEVDLVLYAFGSASPGSTIRLAAVGVPGAPVVIGISCCRLALPIMIPGVGKLEIQPFGLLPQVRLSNDGYVAVSIALPVGFPAPSDFVAQALVGAQLSNPVDVRIR